MLCRMALEEVVEALPSSLPRVHGAGSRRALRVEAASDSEVDGASRMQQLTIHTTSSNGTETQCTQYLRQEDNGGSRFFFSTTSDAGQREQRNPIRAARARESHSVTDVRRADWWVGLAQSRVERLELRMRRPCSRSFALDASLRAQIDDHASLAEDLTQMISSDSILSRRRLPIRQHINVAWRKVFDSNTQVLHHEATRECGVPLFS